MNFKHKLKKNIYNQIRIKIKCVLLNICRNFRIIKGGEIKNVESWWNLYERKLYIYYFI